MAHCTSTFNRHIETMYVFCMDNSQSARVSCIPIYNVHNAFFIKIMTPFSNKLLPCCVLKLDKISESPWRMENKCISPAHSTNNISVEADTGHQVLCKRPRYCFSCVKENPKCEMNRQSAEREREDIESETMTRTRSIFISSFVLLFVSQVWRNVQWLSYSFLSESSCARWLWRHNQDFAEMFNSHNESMCNVYIYLCQPRVQQTSYHEHTSRFC